MPKLKRVIHKAYNPSQETIQAVPLNPRYMGLLLDYVELWSPPISKSGLEISSALRMLVGEQTIKLQSWFHFNEEFVNTWRFRKLTEELIEELSKDPNFEW